MVTRMKTAGLVAAIALGVGTLAHAGISYIDVSSGAYDAGMVDRGDDVRVHVSGSGCRVPEADVPPVVTAGFVEFTIAISSDCFATPPGFEQMFAVPPLALGGYTVRHYLQVVTGAPQTDPPRRLVATTSLRVGTRPVVHDGLAPGAFDPTFGDEGTARFSLRPPVRGTFLLHPRDDGSAVLAGYNGALAQLMLPNGTLDAGFGTDGLLVLPDRVGHALAATPAGSMLVGATNVGTTPRQELLSLDGKGNVEQLWTLPGSGSTSQVTAVAHDMASGMRYAVVDDGSGGCTAGNRVVRIDARGAFDPGFGVAGIASLPWAGCFTHIVPARDGGAWLLGVADWSSEAAFLARIGANGSAETRFGQGGRAPGPFALVPPIDAGDGGVYVGREDFAIVRLDGSGSGDPSFGRQGVAANPTDTPAKLTALARQVDGSFLMAGLRPAGSISVGGNTYTRYRPRVLRIEADGQWDAAFGTDGVLDIGDDVIAASGSFRDLVTLAASNDSNALLAVRPARDFGFRSHLVHRFNGGGSRVSAVEYHHADFDHYFITAFANEQALLDAGAFSGWTRTGQSIGAWGRPVADSVPVCRFFSASFAPKSSHFYTPYAEECELLKSGSVWTYEGIAFHARLPDAAGDCGPGTRPVFRLYNNGASGAPNHRYTASDALRDQMTREGWTPEGSGPRATLMCMPD